MLLKIAAGLLLLAFAGTAAGCAWFRMAPDDPARWHVDPLAAARPDSPNSYLLAPEGEAGAPTDGEAPVWPVSPQALMAAFDQMALSQPRTERIAGSVEDLRATYVQRSAFWGFPDYISVRALPAEDGATLAIFSRSRYGYSDLGVNETRVSSWLDALDAQ